MFKAGWDNQIIQVDLPLSPRFACIFQSSDVPLHSCPDCYFSVTSPAQIPRILLACSAPFFRQQQHFHIHLKPSIHSHEHNPFKALPLLCIEVDNCQTLSLPPPAEYKFVAFTLPPRLLFHCCSRAITLPHPLRFCDTFPRTSRLQDHFSTFSSGKT